MQHKFTPTKHLKRAALTLLALVFACATPSTAFAQNLAEYAFTTGVNQNQWITLSNSATQIVASGQDDACSSLTDIGFSFTFGDGTYTQFWANSNGIFSFNSTPTTNYSNQFNPSNCTKNQPKICGISRDMSTGTDGYVKYELTGTSPNRVLVCEFYLFGNGSNIDPATIKWQVQLHESTSKVVIVYGASSSDPYFFQIGLSQSGSDIWTVDPSTHEATHLTEGVETEYEVWPGENRYYEFAPLPFTISDDGNTYTINSAEGWGMFCDTLTLKPSGYFTGKTVKLGANISITQSAGSDDHRFMGTFDGQEHTLDVNITDTGEQGTAPFRFISNATIRNLHVTGTVTGTTHAAGLVGKASAGTILIENCLVEANVNSTVGNNRHCGGIVGHGFGGNNPVDLTLRNCVYAGTITCDKNYIGGLQGWSDGNTLTLENCLFAGNYQGTATGTAAFHPIALHNTSSATNLTATNVFAAVAPTATNANFIAADGTKTTGRATAPAGLGTQGATYSFMDMTVYENGLYYNGLYYVAPTLSTDNNGAYLINNENDWDYFCDALYNNGTWNRFSGQTVKLGADISVTRMAGYDNHDFLGTFDGNHKTLTFTATATASYLAPFRNVLGNSDTDHAVIHDLNVVTNITAHDQRHMAGLIALVWGYVDVTNCNVTVDITATKGSTNTDLYPAGIASQVVKDAQIAVSGCTVDGTISTDGKYAGGIIGIAQGSATITDCLSSVTIDSSTEGDGTHGGLVAVQGNYDGKTLTIEGCVFNGQLLGASTHSCGGFVGWRSQTVNITNSLFVPVQVTINTVDGNTPCATFVRNWTMPDNANCYYTDALGTPQGTQAYSINSGENVIGVYNTSGYTYTYNTSRLYFYNTGFCHNQGLSTYKQYAAAGDEVHISISTPISCADFITEPAGIPLTLSSNGAYHFFTMPSSNVTINAAWSSSAIVSDFPWTENFNDLTDDGRIPGCWNYMEIEGTFFDRWGYFTTAINGYGATNGTSYDGTNCVRYNSYNNFNGTTNYLKTVPLSLPASPEMQLSFWYKNPAGGDFSVYLSTDGGDTHTTALATGLTNQQEWTPYTISLGAYAGQEVVIVFKGTSNRNFNGDAYIYLDEVNVEDVLPCAKPTRLMATILGTQRVQLGWTNGDEDQTDWQICLDGDESNLIAVDSNPFILDNLEILSTHTVKVRANCGGDGVSYWSNEVSFTMPLHDPVSYLDMNGDTQRCIDFTVLDGSETFPLAAGWYVVDGTLNYNQTLTVSGDVHLILKDNAVMNIGTAETPVSGNGFGEAGQYGFSINIYGQSTGENNGQLNVYASQNGIWAYDGDFNCSSARVSVTASSYGIWALAYNYSSKGNIKLKDATVTVNSTNDHAIYAQGGNINIDGGKVSATGKNYVIYAYKQYYDGGNLTISGSQVTANGGNYGIFASGGSLNISGGQVTASGSTYGILASSGGLNISGGQVTANGGNYGIYSYGSNLALGWTNPTDFIHADSYYIDYSNSNITLSQAFIDEDGNLYSGTVARVNGTYAINGKTLYPYIEGSVPYIDENGERQLCLQGNYTLLEGTETSLGTAGQETWYVADGTRNYSQTITLYGDVHLILKDGAVMNVGTEQQPISGEYGIGENGSLHIYGQSAGSGHLYIYCEEYGISVDDDYEQNGGNVTISAGIHGIFTGGDVTLRDGTLSTIGDSYYGISGGGNVNILGGKCTAKSKQRLTGINANSDGSIILGWKNADDYIDASGYSLSNSNAVVQVADGQAFIDEEGNTYSGIIERDGTTYTYPVDGKKLLPYIEGSVPYLDENGQRQLCTEYTVLDGTETTLAVGWYVADGTLNYNQTLIPSGDVHLILKDNAVMNIGTAETPVSGNGFGDAGPNNFSIDIYGQSTGENNGQLNVYASQYGIWAYNGDFNCSNARVSVTASSYGIWALAYNSSKGSINLKDATVTVNVPGSNAIYAQGGNINIDGGQVSATGNDHVIYAYMQYNGGSITINNSDVTATATSDYCIFASGGSITINNSDVTATATSDYCIFTGNGDIYINGSTVSATGNANVIYADRYSTGGYITIYNSDVTATATSNYCIYAYGGNINIIGSTVSATGNDYVIFSSRYSNGGTIYISGGQVTATATSHNSIFAGGGDLRIISGQVTANGGDYGLYASAGSLYISGGQVTANGGDYGLYASAGSLYISGGQVTANGGNYGIYAYGGTITLGWTNPTDFIHANSYYINYSSTNITLSNDFIDEDNAVYSGTITQVDGAYAIDGKTLYPYSADFVYKSVAGYGDSDGGYCLIASPNVDNTDPATINGMILTGDDAADYDLYRFDPSNEGSEWVNYKTDSFNLVNGHGYLYARKNTKTLVFTGPFITDTDSVAVDLEYDAADDHKCWNLVGNPFPCEATINKPYYMLNADGATINPEAIVGGTIPACTAVFVKGESGDDRVVFSKVSAPASSAPIGAIDGLFSVSADKQVYFSQGNLQYQPSTATWRFAPNQYDLLVTPEDLNLYHSAVGNYADVTSLYTENYTDWIDFFGWGTSGWNSGANAYMPYSTSYMADDFYPGGDGNNDLTGTCANADWAWYNPISNGGNAANQWRTLTHDEWAYLFSGRDGATSKYGHGSVNGVNGMIILPDNWTLPDGCSFTPGNSDWTNSYTTTEWAAMEAAGAVFLPAAGQRSFGTFVNNVGNLGRYWSSTHRNNTAAYDVWFHSDFISELDTQAYSNRSMGYSVRPVQDAQ